MRRLVHVGDGYSVIEFPQRRGGGVRIATESPFECVTLTKTQAVLLAMVLREHFWESYAAEHKVRGQTVVPGDR